VRAGQPGAVLHLPLLLPGDAAAAGVRPQLCAPAPLCQRVTCAGRPGASGSRRAARGAARRGAQSARRASAAACGSRSSRAPRAARCAASPPPSTRCAPTWRAPPASRPLSRLRERRSTEPAALCPRASSHARPAPAGTCAQRRLQREASAPRGGLTRVAGRAPGAARPGRSAARVPAGAAADGGRGRRRRRRARLVPGRLRRRAAGPRAPRRAAARRGGQPGGGGGGRSGGGGGRRARGGGSDAGGSAVARAGVRRRPAQRRRLRRRQRRRRGWRWRRRQWRAAGAQAPGARPRLQPLANAQRVRRRGFQRSSGLLWLLIQLAASCHAKACTVSLRGKVLLVVQM